MLDNAEETKAKIQWPCSLFEKKKEGKIYSIKYVFCFHASDFIMNYEISRSFKERYLEKVQMERRGRFNDHVDCSKEKKKKSVEDLFDEKRVSFLFASDFIMNYEISRNFEIC